MSNNALVGIIIAVILVVGGYFIVTSNDPNDANIDVSGGSADNDNNGGNGSGGEDDYTTPVTITPGVPEVRAGGSASASISTASVTGEVKPNGRATTYWYEYGETSGLGSRTSTQNVGSGYQFIPAPGFITGLKADTTYYYRLSAKNEFGTVNGPTRNFETNQDPRPTGSIPTVITRSATAVAPTGATLNGRIDPNGVATSFWFEYGKDINLGTVASFSSAGAGDTQAPVSVNVSGLEPGTKYYFRLNAQNAFGTKNGEILSFTTRQ